MVITRQLTDSASASTASDIQLGSCVTEIGQGAFSGYTNITDVEFPDSLTTIGAGAFSGSSITSVEFQSSVTTIGNSAFTRCNLEELTIPSGVTSIGYRAFMNNDSLGRINVSASTVPVWEVTHLTIQTIVQYMFHLIYMKIIWHLNIGKNTVLGYITMVCLLKLCLIHQMVRCHM
jgi:hypothetical protein